MVPSTPAPARYATSAETKRTLYGRFVGTAGMMALGAALFAGGLAVGDHRLLGVGAALIAVSPFFSAAFGNGLKHRMFQLAALGAVLVGAGMVVSSPAIIALGVALPVMGALAGGYALLRYRHLRKQGLAEDAAVKKAKTEAKRGFMLAAGVATVLAFGVDFASGEGLIAAIKGGVAEITCDWHRAMDIRQGLPDPGCPALK